MIKGLDLTQLLVWGALLHLIGDWFLQNDWMAKNKAERVRVGWQTLTYGSIVEYKPWWARHPAAWIHAGIHTVIQLVIFPWWAALFIGILHLIVDTRKPLNWWKDVFHQTCPRDWEVGISPGKIDGSQSLATVKLNPAIMDVGMEVAFWQDQVAHLIVLAIAAYASTVF